MPDQKSEGELDQCELPPKESLDTLPTEAKSVAVLPPATQRRDFFDDAGFITNPNIQGC